MFIICAIQIVQEKIDEIFHEYRRMMLSLAYSIVGDSFLTEDAVQEAFIHLNKHAKRFKDTKSKECRNFVYTGSVHAQSRYQCLLSHVITDGTVT